MAALMHGRRSPGTRKRPDPISNAHVEDRGRRYRICRHGGRVIIVALKSLKPGGFERLLDIDGRRARQLIKKAEADG